jgi:pyruvate/2-oxoglutarate dehydrogenase complex dihydrolipoamide dehydrogenase (E3) component
MDFDLIVIGGGTAGLSAMKAAHALGAKVAIVEEEDFAGTCLRTG